MTEVLEFSKRLTRTETELTMTMLEPHSFVDSDWAACLRTRRSMSEVGAKMAGGPIAYKTRLQPTVAMSSTEAKFMVACDAVKMMLFIRTIMWELGIPQHAATVIYEDNDGATAMVNAQKPTSRTRHMDIRFFALFEWVERDLVILQRIHTSVNEADHFTKVLDRTLFYRHVDDLMGHVPPLYSPCYGKVTGNEQIVIPEDVTEEHCGCKKQCEQLRMGVYCSLHNDFPIHI